MRVNESLLRGLIRETLLTEAKIYYPGGDSARGVFDYWKHSMPNDFQAINGRLPTYGEFVKLIEDSAPGFRFQYGANETPDTPLGEVTYRKPGWEFLQSMYSQIIKFVGSDDKRDLTVSRGIESAGIQLRRGANAIRKKGAKEREAEERRKAEEYESTYEPKAPPDSPLGKYAFSPQRQLQMRPPPVEKNTPVESALLRSIRNHFEGERPLTRQQAQLAIGFIRDGLYPDIFKEPPAGTFYRGMLLHIDELERMGVDITRIGDQRKLDLRGNFEIKPLDDRFSSSWSASFDIAEDFSLGRGAGRKNMYSAVFSATTEMNPGKFLDAEPVRGLLDVGSDFGEEKEVIGLGTIWANSVNLVEIV